MSDALTPTARYAADLAQKGFTADQSQRAAIHALQGVYEELIAKPPTRRFGSTRLQWPSVKGLYLWGGVGRGKTYLMDHFFDALPFSRKTRTHFHRFMLEVHERRRQYPDTTDPLIKVAHQIAEETRVICFDEFFVSDIGDAMILGRLLEALFAKGVTLVATSNIEPDGLYKNGLQRQNFFPAISILKKHVTVLNVDGGQDYRLRHLTDAQLYIVQSAHSNAGVSETFARLTNGTAINAVTLSIHGRPMYAKAQAQGVIWFDFSDLCEGPRGAADYIELARGHHTLVLTKVPTLTTDLENEARRFVTLIDELYDRSVKVLIEAAQPIERLYQGQRLQFEFARTVSRLTEMRSVEYLAQAHKP